jgi:hypothetical protein
MASNINPYNVDGTFPVAGQDNPSQGFRDNFTNIKNNFLAAENEISDLQSKVLLTTALIGQSINNDMAGTRIIRPQLAAWTQTLLDNGAVSGSIPLDFNQANFQKITTGGNIALNFINWPTSVGSGALGYGVMRVWISVTDKNHIVTLPAAVTIGSNNLSNYNAGGLHFDIAGDYVFDISSTDGGNNYIITDLTRNHSQFTDTNFYYNTQTSPTMYIGFGGGSLNATSNTTQYFNTGLQKIQSLDAGADILATFGSINSVSVGNLSLANVAYTQIDTGGIAGYSVSSARGNLLTSTVQPVHSGDMLGYVNSIAYTGNVTANTFQQVSSINFFATGANVRNGLGGNIAVFTANDRNTGTGVKQAVGIENDQSVKFYGNVIASNVYVPSSATAAGTAGQISFDSTYIYVCLGPNNWVRTNTAAW